MEHAAGEARSILVAEAERQERRLLELDLELDLGAGVDLRKRPRVAAAAAIACSFEVARGSVAQALASAASSADLVVVGRSGWSVAGRSHVGSTVRALLAGPAARVLVLPPGRWPAAGTCALLDDPATAGRVLAAAVEIAAGGPVAVVVATRDEGVARRQEDQARTFLAAHGVEADVRRLDPSAPDVAARLRAACRPHGMLVAADGARSDPRPATDLLALERPVLFVR